MRPACPCIEQVSYRCIQLCGNRVALAPDFLPNAGIYDGPFPAFTGRLARDQALGHQPREDAVIKVSAEFLGAAHSSIPVSVGGGDLPGPGGCYRCEPGAPFDAAAIVGAADEFCER